MPSFSRYCNLEDAKEHFVDEWRPDLSAIEDAFVKMVLEKIFVLDSIERPTAGDIAFLLQTLNISTNELSARDPVSGEGRRSYIISDSSSSKISFSWTPFVRAITDGDIKAVKRHLSKKGGKNARGDLALMVTANVGHRDVVELLDPTDKSGVTALMRTAERGDVVVARALMTKQKKLRDSDGKTALIHAAQRGCKEAVRVLLEHEKGMKDNQSHSALYHALKTGHMETAKIVLPHEDPTDENGVTALMRAAARGDAEMVELLAPLQKGAKDKDGTTAFAHALKNKHEGIATVLRKHEAPSRTPLMCAAVTGDVETARRHLSGKDKKNSDGETALMLSAKVGNEGIVNLLDSTNSPADSREHASFSWLTDRYYMDTLMTIYPFERNGLQSLFKVEKQQDVLKQRDGTYTKEPRR
ncbi:Atp-dependent protease subunit [Giardia duodenalis]|uniref:Atp-dependent protease subunit n=1 Tax=Giardia intestinalis TaxID=5741 RepID=V6TQ71_GIAIN|nr:Atp-dependent protease subunit [Giardia intestinalis]